jgi:hypothetical protein
VAKKDHKVLELKALPLLKDTPPDKRQQLFLAKLEICKVMFNFDDPDSNIKGKETKRMTLLELVDFVNSPAEQKAYLANESMMKPLLEMVVSSNPHTRALRSALRYSASLPALRLVPVLTPAPATEV